MKAPSKSKNAPVRLPPRNPRNIRAQVATQKSTIGKGGGSTERNRSISPISVNSENADYVEPVKQINAKPTFSDASKPRKVDLAHRTHVEKNDTSDASSVSTIKSSISKRSVAHSVSAHSVSKFTL